MQRFTFNLDTRYNIFICAFPQFLHFPKAHRTNALVSQKCHRLFDNDKFVLIPSHSVIQELKKHKRGQPLSHFDNVCHSLMALTLA